jgi:hypothetical protein
LWARAQLSVRLCPGGERRAPDLAALVAALHDTPRERSGGVLLEFQRVIVCSTEHIAECFRSSSDSKECADCSR